MGNIAYKIEVMRAYEEGKDIQICERARPYFWMDCPDPQWNWEDYNYQIRKFKPSIDWDQVSKEYRYLAQDRDGSLWLFEDMPYYRYDRCWVAESHCDSAKPFASATPGTCDWKDSLVTRPY